MPEPLNKAFGVRPFDENEAIRACEITAEIPAAFDLIDQPQQLLINILRGIGSEAIFDEGHVRDSDTKQRTRLFGRDNLRAGPLLGEKNSAKEGDPLLLGERRNVP